MIVLNFAHPLTADQIAQIEVLAGRTVEQSIMLPVQFDNQQPFLPQLAALMQQVPLTPEEWQTAPILVNLPSLSAIAGLVLAELHGRMGYFPPVVRMRPVENALPPRFAPAEILNLQSVRDVARTRRVNGEKGRGS